MREKEEIITQRVLAPTHIGLADYVINPYRGCLFNCLYCYAQNNKNIKGKDMLKSWKVKINAPEILKKELLIKRPKVVLLGSNTECFTEKEKTYRVTESILNILNAHNIPYIILTKSALIRDYLNLISYHKNNKIFFTINFASQEIINILEENSSPLQERLKTLQEIYKKKIKLCVHIGPFIPYLSSLKDIFSYIAGLTEEINIEVYHHRMGNFSFVIQKIKEYLPAEAEKIKKVYINVENYTNYCKELKKECEKLNTHYRFRINFIFPPFNEYYLPYMYYQYQTNT